MTVGFDFGTTNSLVSAVSGDRVIDVLDSDGRPHPSVVRYEGSRVIVGREAKDALDSPGIGVHGDTVRSPKRLLGEDIVQVAGVPRRPKDIVAEVIRYVRRESLRSEHGSLVGALDKAVVTIPVTMNGPRRAELREAFAAAGVAIHQFVHEPFAALYGYLREVEDTQEMLQALRHRYVLVVDWGGGTLDLTLCRVTGGRVQQVRNQGDDGVGGDRFDEVIREEVVSRFRRENDVADDDRPFRETRSRLLQDTERNKIDLSEREHVTFYRPGYFPRSGTDLVYRLTRDEMEAMTRPLVARGLEHIQSMLTSVGVAPAQVSTVLMVGGMAAMPIIRTRLHEFFGPESVVMPSNAATLVAHGAAWIAHDGSRLVMAKPVEVELARGYRLPIVAAGSKVPTLHETQSDTLDLFCADPEDGLAKFQFSTPVEVRLHPQAGDPRAFLGSFTLRVDPAAPPLFERIKLDVELDDDLILGVRARSSQAGDVAIAEFHELEFGVALPGEVSASGRDDPAPPDAPNQPDEQPHGRVIARSNIAEDRHDQTLVPGDVLYRARPQMFAKVPGNDRATDLQVRERLYYEPCSVCGRKWGHPDCQCAQA